MKHLLALLRAMNLFTHSAHNLCAGPMFFQDHEFFGVVYAEIELDYDMLAERTIGVIGEEPLELSELIKEAAQILSDCPSVGVDDNRTFYKHLLAYEMKLNNVVENICRVKGVSQGTIQLLGNIADKSEARVYKIKQRIG